MMDNSKNSSGENKSLIPHEDEPLENADSQTAKNENKEEFRDTVKEEECLTTQKRSFCQRMFSGMGPGSLRGSVFSMCILSLGTGCLALPQKVGYLSLSFAPVAIIVAGLANMLTLFLLSSMSDKYKIRTYSKLVKELYGKSLSIFLDIIIVINIFGIIILYQVILYKLIGGCVNAIGKYGYKSIDDFLQGSFWRLKKTKFIVNYSVGFGVLFPICLLKDISKMRFATTFGVGSLVIVIMIIAFESPLYIEHYFKYIYDKDIPSTHLNIYDITVGFTKDQAFFKSIATLFYAYSCQIGAFPVMSTLKNNTKRRINKVFRRAIIIDMVCYFFIGITGYLTQPIETPDLIIERKCIFTHDLYMTIGQGLFILTLITKIPANYNAQRVSLLSLMGYDPRDFPNWLNFVITATCLALSTLVCVAYQEITDYISLIGSFCSVIISFLIPGLVYAKGNGEGKSLKNISILGVCIFLSCIGFCSGILTILSIIQKYK